MSIRSNSGCSSGQESGWTLYLGEFSASAVRTQRQSGFQSGFLGGAVEDEEEEEENLSMISDASSGPSHYKYEDSNEIECYTSFPASSSAYSRTRVEEINKKEMEKKYAKGNNGRRRSTSTSSLPGKSEYSSYRDDGSRNVIAESSSATRKTGRSKGSRK
ncbi:hypothetical protein SAY87_031496 [Trapa incisa]|uniref:Uncharacterized protein n=1 Tax=Trapa incisa TaxID=236973 RepID=A0AAN7KR75_9MYRT|nr:hypothetical protein SAY87_031496 [Trapa incisa]